MMHWLDFKKKLEKNKLKNKSIEELKKEINKDRRILFLYFAIFFVTGFTVLIIASSINVILGLAVMGIIFGFILNIMAVAFFYQMLYVFLRKAYHMKNREEFEE